MFCMEFLPLFIFILILNCSGSLAINNNANNPQILFTTEAFYTPLYFNETGLALSEQPYEQLELIPSFSGHADLLPWMRYFHRHNSSMAFLYGTPPIDDDGDIDVDIVILNRLTFNTTSYQLKYRILNREEYFKYEVEMKFFDVDLEDFFRNNLLSTIQRIFVEHLWQNEFVTANDTISSNSLYITQIARPIDVGGRYPVDPADKECVVIRIGNSYNFTQLLYRVESEVSLIKNRRPCPKHFLTTTVEYLFRQNNLRVDWCNFRLIYPAKSILKMI